MCSSDLGPLGWSRFPGAIVAGLNASVQRLIGSLGTLYVVATIAPAFFLPPPPPGGAPVAEIASYYSGHRGALLLAGWVGLLAFPLGFAFVSGLGLVLRGTGAASVWLVVIALVSISVTLAVAAVQGILALAVPYVSSSAAPAEVKLLADITQLGFSATFAFEISYFVASGVLALRSPVIPNWLGYTAVIAAFTALLGSLGVIVGSGPLAAGGPATLMALVASLLWWLAAGLLLLLRPRPLLP